MIPAVTFNPFKGTSKVGRNLDNHTPNNHTPEIKQRLAEKPVSAVNEYIFSRHLLNDVP